MAVDLQSQSGTGNLGTFAKQMPSRPAGMKRASTGLRWTPFAHLQRLSLSFRNRTRSGEHMTKIVSDTNTLKDVFAESALTASANILTFVGMFTIMFFLDWRLGLVVLATLPLLCGTLYYRYRAAKASSRRQRKREAVIATRISEVMSTVPLVQAFGRERHEQERFEAEGSEFLVENIRNARIEAVATRSVVVISALGTAAVVLVGSLQVLAGRMTPGDLLLFTSYVQSMYRPVRNLARLSNKYSKAIVGAERINGILEVEPEIRDEPDAIEASELKGEVVFEDVSFDYGDDDGVLKDVSFTIRPGQRVALVGASGAGKSTLVSLILRLYQPQEGSIRMDGVNIRDYKLKSLRRQIGIVLQDSVLFGATIRENVAYGRLDATDEEIEAAARVANAHDFIVRLEDGYDTVLGERGDTLSGGQRQRIAIARESRWIDTWYRERVGLTPEGHVTPDFIPLLVEHPRFPQLEVGREDLEGLLPNGQPVSYRSFVSGVFDLHGRALGKSLVGDKTPRYVRSIPTLHGLWPEAKFVHLIRDGRDVCLSALEWKSGGELARRFETWKTDPVATAGVWWDWLVRLGREAGRDLGSALYREVRYESLVSGPAEECTKLCEFLGIPYDGAMLRFHEEREREAPGLSAKGSWKRVTTGLRDWRTELSGEDVELFEAAAGNRWRSWTTAGPSRSRGSKRLRRCRASASRSCGKCGRAANGCRKDGRDEPIPLHGGLSEVGNDAAPAAG